MFQQSGGGGFTTDGREEVGSRPDTMLQLPDERTLTEAEAEEQRAVATTSFGGTNAPVLKTGGVSDEEVQERARREVEQRPDVFPVQFNPTTPEPARQIERAKVARAAPVLFAIAAFIFLGT